MKSKITNKFFAGLILCTAFLVSCNKDDDNNDAAPDDMPGCKLVKAEEIYGNDKYVTEATYNAAGYLIKLTETDYDNNIPDVPDITTYSYNTNNQLVKQTEDDGDYTTYEYNGNGLLTKISEFESNNVLDYSETYSYDSNKRLTEATETDPSSPTVYKRTFEYDSRGNISRVNYFVNGQADGTVIYENYDDKFNPYYALTGIVLPGVSKNNPGKITDVYKSDRNGDGVEEEYSDVYTYTYKYNASGFVTESVEKEAGDPDDTTLFTYSGCN